MRCAFGISVVNCPIGHGRNSPCALRAPDRHACICGVIWTKSSIDDPRLSWRSKSSKPCAAMTGYAAPPIRVSVSHPWTAQLSPLSSRGQLYTGRCHMWHVCGMSNPCHLRVPFSASQSPKQVFKVSFQKKSCSRTASRRFPYIIFSWRPWRLGG